MLKSNQPGFIIMLFDASRIDHGFNYHDIYPTFTFPLTILFLCMWNDIYILVQIYIYSLKLIPVQYLDWTNFWHETMREREREIETIFLEYK